MAMEQQRWTLHRTVTAAGVRWIYRLADGQEGSVAYRTSKEAAQAAARVLKRRAHSSKDQEQ